MSVVQSYTLLERRFLKRRVCGLREAPLTARRCQAMYGKPCSEEQMVKRRQSALATYRPRARATQEPQP